MHEITELTVREALKQASSLLMRAFAQRAAMRDGGGDAGVAALGAEYADEARADAEVLLMHVLGWDKTRLLLEGDAPFPAGLMDRWREAVARRAGGEPVQYITGEQEFFGMAFEVGPAVLIPRPETELLVEAVAKRVRALFAPDGDGGFGREAPAGLSLPGRHGPQGTDAPANRQAGAERTNRTPDGNLHEVGAPLHAPLLADIGTGSGAIAITLARLLPGWRVAACDLSPDALEIARRNARRAAGAESSGGHGGGGANGAERWGGRKTDGPGGFAGQEAFGSAGFIGHETDSPGGKTGREWDGDGRLADRIRFLQGDLLEPLIAAGERVDVLVSNPPYIPSGDLARLQPEVRDHEPRLALDGGPDGLDVYRRIVRQIERLPVPPRLAAFEVGQGQARAVAGLLTETGWWSELEIVRDYADIERHVLARRT